MGVAGGPDLIQDGLVLSLDASDRNSYVSGSTTWFDLAGTNNGTLTNGPTFNTGSLGNIILDGTDDYIQTNLNLNFTSSDFTLNSWVYPEFDSATYGRPIITKNGNGGCSTYDFALEYGRQTNKFQFIMDGGTANPGLYTTTFPKNAWYNVVATRQFLGGTNYKCSIYVNGNLNSTVTGNFTGGYGTSTTIGKFIDCAPVDTWLGKIAAVDIYNRALSADEIQQNYNAQKSKFGL